MKSQVPKSTKNTKKAGKTSFLNIGHYFTRKTLIIIGFLLLILGFVSGFTYSQYGVSKSGKVVLGVETEDKLWFLLFRKSNVEILYKGVPGNETESKIVRTFRVKAGVPGKRPTPLPQTLGREYWLITKKFDSSENLETAPYFIELDVPAPEEQPYGPVPYLECAGAESAYENGQCNWEMPGPFGLHGVNSDLSRLSSENEGSSGCIRHTDEDITYLYNLLDVNQEIRYYIRDE